MIAPARPAAALGAIQPQTSVHRTREWLVSTLMMKRTQRGHGGQSADRSATGGSTLLRGNQQRMLLQNTRGDLLPASCPALQPSGPCFVRPVRAVSVST